MHVNLIPYNAQSGPTAFAAPSHEVCKAFKTALQGAGLFTKIRVEKGAEKMAACGQLGNVRLRRELNAKRRAEAEAAEAAAAAEAVECSDLEQEEEAAARVAASAAAEQLQPDGIGIQQNQMSCTPLCGRRDLDW